MFLLTRLKVAKFDFARKSSSELFSSSETNHQPFAVTRGERITRSLDWVLLFDWLKANEGMKKE